MIFLQISLQTELIYIPINLHNTHWLFLEITTETNAINYFNSLPSTEREGSKIFKIVKMFLELLEKQAHQDSKIWKCNIADFPRQRNMNDCGVFMLKGIHYRIMEANQMFNQKDIPYFRMLITSELLQGKLLN